MSFLPLLAGAARALPALSRAAFMPEPDRERLIEQRLAATLRAAAAIPFYAERFPAGAEAADLERLPILTRSSVEILSRSVRSRLPRSARVRAAHSSGSTGNRVEFLFDQAHEQGRLAARMRYLWMHGWRPHQRSAWLIGLLPGSHDGRLSRAPYLLGARFFSHIEDFAAQAAWLRELDPPWLYSMPSNLDALLPIFRAERLRLPRLRRIFSGGEVLDDSIRAGARDVLGVEIADNYGATEAFLGFECPEQSLHVNAEHVRLEIVDDDGRAVAPGAMGRVLVTTLENAVMPLVRYEIGDYAIAAAASCTCGRTLPRIARILGRTLNLFHRQDGRLFSPWALLEPPRKIPGVRRVQLVQKALGEFEVRYVADAALEPSVAAAIEAALQEALGEPGRFLLQPVSDIPRTAAGKFIAALCEIR